MVETQAIVTRLIGFTPSVLYSWYVTRERIRQIESEVAQKASPWKPGRALSNPDTRSGSSWASRLRPTGRLTLP